MTQARPSFITFGLLLSRSGGRDLLVLHVLCSERGHEKQKPCKAVHIGNGSSAHQNTFLKEANDSTSFIEHVGTLKPVILVLELLFQDSFLR